MDGASLYEIDVVAWSEEQVAKLRALAGTAGSNAVDWENVIEEIESVGRSEWKGVESQFAHALAHVLKVLSDPGSFSSSAWAAETNTALVQGRHDYRRSMARLLDIDSIWMLAFRRATGGLSPFGFSIPPGIPRICPFSLDDLVDETFTSETAMRTLRLAMKPSISSNSGD